MSYCIHCAYCFECYIYVGGHDKLCRVKGNFFDNCGPQNETHCAKVFKMFFDDELVELIVRETNTYAAQKIQARSFIPLRSRMRDWKPVAKDKKNDET